MSEVVEDDQLVEQQQIDVLEALRILGIQPEGRLSILEVIIREIADEASGERRESLDAGAPVLIKNLADLLVWVIRP